MAQILLEKFEIKKVVRGGKVVRQKKEVHKLKPKAGFDRKFINGREQYVKLSQDQRIAKKKKHTSAHKAHQKKSSKVRKNKIKRSDV